MPHSRSPLPSIPRFQSPMPPSLTLNLHSPSSLSVSTPLYPLLSICTLPIPHSQFQLPSHSHQISIHAVLRSQSWSSSSPSTLHSERICSLHQPSPSVQSILKLPFTPTSSLCFAYPLSLDAISLLRLKLHRSRCSCNRLERTILRRSYSTGQLLQR